MPLTTVHCMYKSIYWTSAEFAKEIASLHILQTCTQNDLDIQHLTAVLNVETTLERRLPDFANELNSLKQGRITESSSRSRDGN